MSGVLLVENVKPGMKVGVVLGGEAGAIRCASPTVLGIGFSTMPCLRASSAAVATPARIHLGLQTSTMSMSALAVPSLPSVAVDF